MYTPQKDISSSRALSLLSCSPICLSCAQSIVTGPLCAELSPGMRLKYQPVYLYSSNCVLGFKKTTRSGAGAFIVLQCRVKLSTM